MNLEAIQIQIPSDLLQHVKNKIDSYEEKISNIVIEQLKIMVNKKEKKIKEQDMLQYFRDIDLVMSSDRQQSMAENIISSLKVSKIPTHSSVRSSLSKLKVPLSEEVLAMRGE